MNGLVTEGIPLGVAVQILTSGLSLGPPSPPPEEVESSGMLQLGITGTLVDNKTGLYIGEYYNLPVSSTRITVQAIGTLTTVTILLSHDGITFAPTLEPTSLNRILSLETTARWIQAQTVGTGVTVLVNARREKF